MRVRGDVAATPSDFCIDAACRDPAAAAASSARQDALIVGYHGGQGWNGAVIMLAGAGAGEWRWRCHDQRSRRRRHGYRGVAHSTRATRFPFPVARSRIPRAGPARTRFGSGVPISISQARRMSSGFVWGAGSMLIVRPALHASMAQARSSASEVPSFYRAHGRHRPRSRHPEVAFDAGVELGSGRLVTPARIPIR